jgi:NAD(P)-dependent dehydrogenase (short-subunit alcohol dehydrogenase family)
MNLINKVVVITGAASGIGAASARLFAENKAKVVVSDLNLTDAQKLVAEIKSNGGEAIAIETNVAKHEAVKELMEQTVAHYGQIDILVNNAGIGPSQMKKVADHTLEDWDRVIAVNQSGVFYGMKYALQHMLTQGHGNIVNVASLAGLKASGNNISYSASKFAVVGMTKSAALEYAKKNIRVNAVCPGYTYTKLLDQLFAFKPEMEEILKSHVPMGRYGEATEIAESIAWLASDSSQFITGQTITLDGGTSL